MILLCLIKVSGRVNYSFNVFLNNFINFFSNIKKAVIKTANTQENQVKLNTLFKGSQLNPLVSLNLTSGC